MNSFRLGWPLLLGLIVGSLLFILMDSYAGLRGARDVESERQKVARELQHAQDVLERILHERLALAYGLKGFVELKTDYTAAEFKIFADEMVANIKGIRALEIAKGSIIRDICPLQGNEKAVNLDLKKIPREWRIVEAAIRDRAYKLSGPIQLVQGGQAIISRLPIFNEDKYWGLAIVIVDLDFLLKDSLSHMERLNIDIAIRGRDGLGDQGAVFSGDPALFQADPERVPIRVPGGSWIMAGTPKSGWRPAVSRWSVGNPVIWLALAAGLLTWWLTGIPQNLQRAVASATKNLKDRITMLDAAYEGMAYVGNDRVCRDMNPSFKKLFGPIHQETVVFDEIVGNSALEQALTLALNGEAQSKFINTGSSSIDERILSVTITPVRGAQNKIGGAIFVARDVTARKRGEEEMHKHERLHALGVLAGGIAHDFNNYLSAILGNLELIRLQHVEGEDINSEVDNLRSSVHQAAGLTRQLLTFSTGGVPVREVVWLDALLKGNIKFTLAGSKVQGRLEIEPNVPAVHVDPTQISQVVNNIVLNARQAMTKGGQIIMRLRGVDVTEGDNAQVGPGRWTEIVIEDDGPGMKPEILSRIFDPFFTTKSEGSGIGLAVAHSVIAKHDGMMFVDSQPNVGTTFTIYLPAAEGNVEPEPEVPAPQIVDATNLKVLVLDDSEAIRLFVRRLMTAAGQHVFCAASSIEATALMKTEGPFDLAILDLTLPGDLDGIDVLTKLRDIDSKLPAIAMSGYTTHDVMDNPGKYGFQGTLKKPFTFDKLIVCAQDVVRAGVDGSPTS